MAIAFVQEVSHATAAPHATSWTIPVTNATTAGHLLILSFTNNNFDVNNIFDSKGNTWTKDSDSYTGEAVIASTGQDGGALTTSDTITINFTGSVGGNAAVAVHEFSGCDTSASRVDKKASAAVTASTSRNAGTTATSTSASALVWAAFGVNGVETSFTAGSGYTAPATSFYAAATGASIEFEYQIAAATGTFSPTATGGVTANAKGAVVVYKAAAAGGAGFAYVQRTGSAVWQDTTSISTLTIGVAADPAAGNLIVVGAGYANSNLAQVSDTQGNTWRIGQVVRTPLGQQVAAAYTLQDVGDLTVNDAITLAFDGPVFTAAAMANEYSGGVVSLDQASSGTFANTTSRNAGTTPATTHAAELVVAVFGLRGLETGFTAGSGYTVPADGAFVSAGTQMSVETEYQVASATAAFSPTGTGGVFATGAGVCLTFSASALDLSQAGGMADAFETNVPTGATGTLTFQSDQFSGWGSKGYGFTVSIAAASPGFTQTATQTAGAFIATASSGGAFHSIDGGTTRLPLLSVAIDVTNPPTTATRTWTDITTLVRSLDFSRSGRNDEFLRTSPGTLTATVDNRADVFTGLGPKSRQWVRVQAQWSGVTYTLWTGIVEGITRDWPEAGRDATCTVTAADVFKIWRLLDLGAATQPGTPVGAVQPIVPVSFPQQRCDQRIATLLQLAGIASKTLDTDTDTIDADGPFNLGTDALTYALNIELSENGLLIANADGTVSFQGRHWRLVNSTSTLGTFTDAGGGGIPSESDAEYVDDDSRLANIVSVTPFGSTTPVTSVNTDSQATYWATRNQSIDRSLLTSDTTVAQAGADWLSSVYGAPSPRIPALTVNLAAASQADPTFIPPLMAAENSQQFTWNRGSLTGIKGYVEQISHSITPDVSWVMKLQLSPVVDTIGWVLGDATYGQLGNTTRLNW